jgi:fluoride exporter
MTTWLNLMAVAAGGAIGSVARHLITLISTGIPGGSSILGTTIANVLGCAAIGAFSQYSQTEGLVSERMRLAVQVGFLGGLTTFSTFAHESAVLADTGRMPLAGLYVAANLFIGWAALMAGTAIVKGWMT